MLGGTLGNLARSGQRLEGLEQLATGAGGAKPQKPDGCTTNPLFATLLQALQKLALLEQDPVEASFQIHAAWEEDPSIFEVCPVGLITALVYLSIAQEREWKYKLLHRATYLLYSTPDLAQKMVAGKWPLSDKLIRTMYQNSEVVGRTPLKFAMPEAQPRPSQAMVADPDLDETVGLSLQHRNSVQVHFQSVLFYHFYHSERTPCSCRTRSWCLPRWMRHLTNHTVDVWLAARDEQKTLFRMDRTGCLQNLGIGLGSHYFAEAFDVVFVFEINAYMHPQARIVPAKRILLYPTYDLSDAQAANFEDLGTSVLPDDGLMKPPNPMMRKLLEDAANQRRARSQNFKDRLLIFPADIRPMKGQTEFLAGLLFEGSSRPSAVQRLRGLTIVVAGGCDGNQTYCQEVIDLTQRVNAEGLINVVVADALKDEELAQLYAAAMGVVLHSRVDCNPRAVYEGLIADCPFFVTERTRLPPLVQHLGHTSSGDKALLPEELADFVDFCQAGGFGNRAGEFARRYLSEEAIYRQTVEWMDQKFLQGKVLDPLVRNEDPLSGGLAGSLGGLLGGGGGGGAGGLAGLLGSLGGGGLGAALAQQQG